MAWLDLEKKENKNGGDNSVNKVEYVKLNEGVTKIRVIDEQPESRWTHWMPMANEGKGLSVRCTGKGCPLCAEISKDKKEKKVSKFGSSKSHAINVINRNTGRVEVLDKGNKIFEGLLNILKQMGDLRNYDVTITTTKTGGDRQNVSYTVLPTFPPSPLSAEDIKLAEGKYDLKEITKAFTNEQILMFMNGATIEQVNADVNNENNASNANGVVDVTSFDFTAN